MDDVGEVFFARWDGSRWRYYSRQDLDIPDGRIEPPERLTDGGTSPSCCGRWPIARHALGAGALAGPVAPRSAPTVMGPPSSRDSAQADPPHRSPATRRSTISGSQTLDYAGPRTADEIPDDLTEVAIGWFGPADPAHPLHGDLWTAAPLAVEEANRAGGWNGLPFRLLPRWSENVWGSGVSQVARMVYEDRVWAILGSVDGAATHLAEQIVAKARLPLVSPVSTDESVNLAGVPWMFSLAPADRSVGTGAGGEPDRDRGRGGVCAGHRHRPRFAPGHPGPARRAGPLRPRSLSTPRSASRSDRPGRAARASRRGQAGRASPGRRPRGRRSTAAGPARGRLRGRRSSGIRGSRAGTVSRPPVTPPTACVCPCWVDRSPMRATGQEFARRLPPADGLRSRLGSGPHLRCHPSPPGGDSGGRTLAPRHSRGSRGILFVAGAHRSGRMGSHGTEPATGRGGRDDSQRSRSRGLRGRQSPDSAASSGWNTTTGC